MTISIPTQIVVYALGCLAVIVVIGAIAWAVTATERYITRKREEEAARRK